MNTKSKKYVKLCARHGCENVFKSRSFNSKYCGDPECKQLVADVNRQNSLRKEPPKLRKAERIRREENSVRDTQKWLSKSLTK